MHSTASDGGYRPAELIQKCKQVDLAIVALTDHDTMSGVEEAMTAGQQYGVHVIPGIEFSTKCQGKSVHILGYGLDWKDKDLSAMLIRLREMRRKRLDVILEKLQSVGIHLNTEAVLAHVDGGSIGRPHVAKALIDHHYVTDVAEAFDLYLGEEKPCYVEKEKEMTPAEAIGWIHRTGGVAVLAHPVYYHLDSYIEEWVLHHQLDGIEVFHRDHSAEVIARYSQLVDQIERKHGCTLLRTGGSDFHHEDYGRVREPLGDTRIDNSYAYNLLEKLNVK